VREQSGEAVFDIVERIRQSSVRFRRDEDIAARRELAETLNSTPPGEALQIIRAFSFFSPSPTSPKISTTFAAPVPTL
jgi:phosphoenolpyruvate carboxylase